MVVRIGRVLAAVVVMLILLLILLVNVQPTVGEVPLLLRPISSAGKLVTTTTTKVVKTSAATVDMVVAAPKNVLTKVGNTITGKKSK